MLPYSADYSDTISLLSEASKQIVERVDRSAFDRYMAVVEKYVNDNELTVHRESKYFYKIYAKFPVFVARAIATLIHSSDPDGFGMYTVVLTKTPNKELTISVCGRDIVSVNMNIVYRGASVVDVMISSHEDGYFEKGTKLKVFGPDLRLVSNYRTLSNPAKHSEWISAMDDEKKNREQFISAMKMIYGGKRDDRNDRNDRGNGHGHGRANGQSAPVSRSEKAREACVDIVKYITASKERQDSHLFVGRTVTSEIFASNKSTTGRPNFRLQIITANTMEREIDIMKLAMKKHNPASMKIIEYQANIPVYPGLKYCTIYLDGNIPVVDIFDCGERELFPSMLEEFHGYMIRIGAFQVLLLFTLVNIWLVRLQSMLDSNTANDVMDTIVKSNFEQYEVLSEMFSSADSDIIFPIEESDYIGTYIDGGVTAKREAWEKKKANIYYPPFYPAQ